MDTESDSLKPEGVWDPARVSRLRTASTATRAAAPDPTYVRLFRTQRFYSISHAPHSRAQQLGPEIMVLNIS
jgi:hypothetical protein